MGDNSLVRTATLPVVNESLQSFLFSSDKLILSDYGWRNGDHSTLRVSSQFDCRGSGAQAYGKHLLFADTAVEFDESAHALRELSADEIAQDRTAIANRQSCVLKRKLVDDAHIIDYANIPPNAVFSCMSPDEYQKLQASLSNNP